MMTLIVLVFTWCLFKAAFPCSVVNYEPISKFKDLLEDVFVESQVANFHFNFRVVSIVLTNVTMAFYEGNEYKAICKIMIEEMRFVIVRLVDYYFFLLNVML